jgi:nucleoside-diphosphate-sugar epimerase
VAAGGRISLRDLIRALQRLLGQDVEAVYGPSREGDVRDSQADISKARKLLGFEPKVSFEDGLRETVAWFQSRSAASR